MDYQKEANTMAARVIKADPVIDELCKAMGLESYKINRIQLDLRYGSIPVIEVTMFGDERLLGMAWPNTEDSAVRS
jgi:hypothetical protein